MKNTNITKIIKENNINKEIHWSVIENNEDLIVITNDYDKSVRFEIKLHQGEGNDIEVLDVNGWKNNVTYLIHGTERWADFTNPEDGIIKAVKAIVKFFYYYY